MPISTNCFPLFSIWLARSSCGVFVQDLIVNMCECVCSTGTYSSYLRLKIPFCFRVVAVVVRCCFSFGSRGRSDRRITKTTTTKTKNTWNHITSSDPCERCDDVRSTNRCHSQSNDDLQNKNRKKPKRTRTERIVSNQSTSYLKRFQLVFDHPNALSWRNGEKAKNKRRWWYCAHHPHIVHPHVMFRHVSFTFLIPCVFSAVAFFGCNKYDLP